MYSSAFVRKRQFDLRTLSGNYLYMINPHSLSLNGIGRDSRDFGVSTSLTTIVHSARTIRYLAQCIKVVAQFYSLCLSIVDCMLSTRLPITRAAHVELVKDYIYT